MMTIEAFRGSLASDAPPGDASPALQALWWAGKGDWDRAHDRGQQHEGSPGCDLVHAHLHRQEGDLGNAGYWYRQAGRQVSTSPLQDEWESIAAEQLRWSTTSA